MHNRAEIEGSQECGCFYCGALFSPKAIAEWWDDDDSAVCPGCGIDAVIGNASGFPITAEFMDKMHARWL